jgi:hypothetical protein
VTDEHSLVSVDAVIPDRQTVSDVEFLGKVTFPTGLDQFFNKTFSLSLPLISGQNPHCKTIVEIVDISIGIIAFLLAAVLL